MTILFPRPTMFRQLLLIVLVCKCSSALGEVDEVIVQTSSGLIRGITVSVLDSQVDAFLGIPYALPPVGELRFQKPVPIEPWLEIFNATTIPPPCHQNITKENYFTPKKENISEDCLYLNIWVPRTPNSTPKPKAVMVWIFGGAFNIGSSDMDYYDGSILAAYGDVIVASINFRVGALGFFTAFTENAPGNLPLHDQILALKWLNENLEAFGGDKNRITAFGESSGAMCIGGLLISPIGQNLFQRAILQSGGALLPLYFESRKSMTKQSNSLAVLTGCANQHVNITTDPEKVVSCLKSLPPSEISSAEGKLKMSVPLTFYPIYGDEVMPIDIAEMMHAGRFESKDILVGINTEEGAFFLVEALPQYFGVHGFGGISRVSKSLAQSLIMGIFKALGQKNEKEIAEYYLKRLKTRNTDTLRKAIYDSLGDFLISCSSLLFADVYSRKSDNTYFYVYSHVSSQTHTEKWLGSTHYEEIPFIFGVPLREGSNFTKEEDIISRRIMDRWTSFAKTGNPSAPNELKWPKYRHEYPAYLNIDIEESIKMRPNEGRCEFWRDRFRANINYSHPQDHITYNYLRSLSSSHQPVLFLWAPLTLLFMVFITFSKIIIS